MIRPRSVADAPSTVTGFERRRRHQLQLAIDLHRHRSPSTQHDRQRVQRIDECGANGGIPRGEQHAHRDPNRRTSTTPKPNVPQVVAHESPPALFTITYRRRHVDCNELGRVAHAPTGHRHIRGEQPLFSPDPEHLVEPAHRKKGRGANDRPTRYESQNRRTRQIVGWGQRTGRHRDARRVRNTVGADHDFSCEDCQTRMRGEQARRDGQRAGLPPRVVIGEGHVGPRGDRHPHVSTGGTTVLLQCDHSYRRIGRGHRLHGVVVRAVVHHDDLGRVRQGQQSRQCAKQLVTPVARDHHDRHIVNGHDHPVPQQGPYHRYSPCRRETSPLKRRPSTQAEPPANGPPAACAGVPTRFLPQRRRRDRAEHGRPESPRPNDRCDRLAARRRHAVDALAEVASAPGCAGDDLSLSRDGFSGASRSVAESERSANPIHQACRGNETVVDIFATRQPDGAHRSPGDVWFRSR